MPIVRKEVYEFADLWNVHKIRPQKNRPSIVTGKPVVLYFMPPNDELDFGKIIPDNCPKLQELRKDVESYDLDEYIPQDTMQFCLKALEEAGIPLNSDGSLDYLSEFEGAPTHKIAYLCLRDILHHYLDTGTQLSICMPPRGAYKWDSNQKFKVQYAWNSSEVAEDEIPEVDLGCYEGTAVCEDDGPHYIDWGDRYEDGGSSSSDLNSQAEGDSDLEQN